MTITERFAKLDRRWLFLLMGLVIVVPLVLKLGMAPKATDAVRSIYDAVEALQPGDVVLVSCDYDPGSEAELYPMNVAVFHHLATKDVRIITTQLWPQGPPMVEKALIEAYFIHGKEYGKDVANLGYKPAGQILISKMVQSIRDPFPTDVKGTLLNEVPAMKGVSSLKDVDLIIVISAGTPGTKEWVQQCQSQLGTPMASGVTAVSAPDFFAYVDSGQLIGLMGGLAGAAEYEGLLVDNNVLPKGARGMAGMGAQMAGHILIVLFIILGNIGYLMSRSKKGRA